MFLHVGYLTHMCTHVPVYVYLTNRALWENVDRMVEMGLQEPREIQVLLALLVLLAPLDTP